tara:strand:+ start:442 stop:624 length:183 start_codon:yes stop_codon:yes gene_type:complete
MLGEVAAAAQADGSLTEVGMAIERGGSESIGGAWRVGVASASPLSTSGADFTALCLNVIN